MSRLENRTAIITGASAGIGAAAARRLHREGARLVLNARRADRVEALARETGGVAVPGDVTDSRTHDALIEACEGRIDVLVNNAGYGEPGPVELVTDGDARRQFEVNVFAAGALIRRVMPLMRARRDGCIVNVSSIAGRFGYPLFGWYCASKHALEGLSDALRIEARPFGIRVVLIEPGPIETEFFDVARGRGARLLGDDGSPYAPMMAHAGEIERDMRRHAATAEQVAGVIARAVLARRPRDRYQVTAMAKTTSLLARWLPRSWLDAAIRRQFRVPGPEGVGGRLE